MVKAADMEMGPVSALFVIGQENYVCGSSIHARGQVSMLKAAGVEIGPLSDLLVIGEEKMSVAAVSMQGHRYPC